jgi:hypothetical protein
MSDSGSESSWVGCISSDEDEFTDLETVNIKHIDLKSQSPRSDAENFDLFGKMAVEIRCLIWTASIEPRLVHWRPGCEPPTILRKAYLTKSVCANANHYSRC